MEMVLEIVLVILLLCLGYIVFRYYIAKKQLKEQYEKLKLYQSKFDKYKQHFDTYKREMEPLKKYTVIVDANKKAEDILRKIELVKQKAAKDYAIKLSEAKKL